MSEKRGNVEFNGFGPLAIFILFLVFWGQGGWYRIDCALGVARACELIADEYKAKVKP